MSETRIIKKYPNRRLYDTAISSYITLADVKRLVLDSVDFEVVDAKTKADLTRSILLQIIAEEEEGGEPIFSSELLAQFIRAYGGTMQNMLTSYLEKSMELWTDQQRVFRERTKSLMDNSPMAMLSQIAERNLQMWQQAMSGFGPEDEQGGEGKRPGQGGPPPARGPASAKGAGAKAPSRRKSEGSGSGGS